MPAHLRFKRHVRFLRSNGTVHALNTLDKGVELPATEAFEALLDALSTAPLEVEARRRLRDRMACDDQLVDVLIGRLMDTGLIERFDPAQQNGARFDRQLHFFDALAPVKDHAESIGRQERLAGAHVLILGLGGIGHQVALSLAAAGVGTLTLVDGDVVEESNLHRQILFSHADIGRYKVMAAYDGLMRVAPTCRIHTRNTMVSTQDDWIDLIGSMPGVRHVMISADRPVQLVNWVSDARTVFDYHCIKCGYMNTQGLIGPLLGPGTKGYEELFDAWGPMIDAQPEAIRTLNERAVAPTMAASNAIMANIAALELIKHITGAGELTLLGQRLLLDLTNYTTRIG